MTAVQVQRRRGTTAQHTSFTGAAGELTVDTDKTTVVVHDGATAGGRPLLRADANVRTVVGTTDTITQADLGRVVAYTSGSAVAVTVDDAVTVGFQCALVQRGAGQVSVAVEGADTLESRSSLTKLAGQHAIATVIRPVSGVIGLYGDLGT